MARFRIKMVIEYEHNSSCATVGDFLRLWSGRLLSEVPDRSIQELIVCKVEEKTENHD